MDFIDQFINFFNHPFFIIFGGLSATLLILGIILNIIFWAFGIAPLLWRLGYGRWTRKIDIVANQSKYAQLSKDLIDSGVFRKKNVNSITDQSLSDIKESNLLLVHYQSFTEEEIKVIIANKKSKAGMIFYFPEFSPQKGISIPDEIRDLISNTQNTTLVNFRGRLLNDIVTTLITTSYDS